METAAAPVEVLVVGAGPVGLACAMEASRQGLSHVVVERGALLGTLVRWPTHTVFFSTPELLEIGGHPFATASGKPTRREGLAYYPQVAEREGLEIRLHESVLSLTGSEGLFRVTTTKGVRAARAVVVATGFFDTPNLLDVPGEDLPKVSHYYTEPFAHAKTDVLVLGGKNSAVEEALALYRNIARGTIAVRPQGGVRGEREVLAKTRHREPCQGGLHSRALRHARRRDRGGPRRPRDVRTNVRDSERLRLRAHGLSTGLFLLARARHRRHGRSPRRPRRGHDGNERARPLRRGRRGRGHRHRQALHRERPAPRRGHRQAPPRAPRHGSRGAARGSGDSQVPGRGLSPGLRTVQGGAATRPHRRPRSPRGSAARRFRDARASVALARPASKAPERKDHRTRAS